MKIERIQHLLKDNEAAIVVSDVNRFYLTGFRSSAGLVYISRKNAVLLIDFRYFEKACKTVNGCKVEMLVSVYNQLNKYISDDKVTSVYVETTDMTLSAYAAYCKNLVATVSNESLISDELVKMRSVKSADEISCIKIAQSFVDETFEYIIDRIAVGRTEKEIMLDMEFYMRKIGSDGVSFDFIVLSGKNTSLPHGTPTDKKVEDGDLVTMDFGGVYNGYSSDMTRTVAVGHIKPEQKTAYEVVLKAQLNAMSMIKSGVPCKDVDKVARELIEKHGYKGCFEHALGHSLGVEVHESPSFSPKSDATLESGNVMTVEPGIYVNGEFGIRIEDTVVVKDDGYENITKSPKDLKIL